ncbi:Aldo/keto reductase [Sodiomyces alkalinus F11]|uniref:Aldo/keto reductase n=1 Tax=Sodiomyces alkalinus (strain CBS 110278 / VKM F-3762 / F11) TaxID=1314773 RepID=A0A3N2Q0L7_SODAK|nr:Aldo/keto reductase [Sodiomyces alkalinus F11]ROT40280.1 Aldo/keto reductase [Sodiomyces alkalinus F11]
MTTNGIPSTDLAVDAPLPLPAQSVDIPGVTSIPRLIYGTAWKADRTARLVTDALSAGFRAIDTAAQPSHYREDLVGAGLRAYLSSPGCPVTRSSLYIQTKFTPTQLWSPNLPTPLPYDPSAPIEAQIRSSLFSSLAHLSHLPSTEHANQQPQGAHGAGEGAQDAPYLDALILHTPLATHAETLRAWRVMEQFAPHPVRRLGISNVFRLEDIDHLVTNATIKPSFVQNRFYPDTSHDRGIRALCRHHGIIYQSFWTLTANARLLRSAPVDCVASAAAVPVEVALYAFVLALGHNCVLDGTSRRDHMRADLDGLRSVAAWSATEEGRAPWREHLAAFRGIIDDMF